MGGRELLKILKKYRLGQASREGRQIIDVWYDASQQDEFAHEGKLNDELETLYLKNITDRIGKPEVVTHNVMTTRQIKLISSLVAIAASLLLVIWVGQYSTLRWSSPNQTTVKSPPGDWEIKTNSGKTAQTVRL